MPSASRLARLWFLVHVWEKVDHHDAESSVNVFLALVETLSRSLERLNIISRLEAMITNAMEYIFHSILSLSLAWSISFEYLCAHYAHRIHFEWVFEFPGFSFLHTRANKQTYLRSRTLNMAKLFFFTREVVCGGGLNLRDLFVMLHSWMYRNNLLRQIAQVQAHWSWAHEINYR